MSEQKDLAAKLAECIMTTRREGRVDRLLLVDEDGRFLAGNTRGGLEERIREQLWHHVEARVRDAAETIISCWSDWEGSAEQDAQQAQDPREAHEAMVDQLTAVLTGMVMDPGESPIATPPTNGNNHQ